MIKSILILSLLVSFSLGQKRTPAMYWESLEMKEKVAFVNGVYAAGAKLKFHHRQEVKKQFNQDPNWVEPYYIERFYEIVDEHRSKKAGYQVNLVAEAMDAFIPIMIIRPFLYWRRYGLYLWLKTGIRKKQTCIC